MGFVLSVMKGLNGVCRGDRSKANSDSPLDAQPFLRAYWLRTLTRTCLGSKCRRAHRPELQSAKPGRLFRSPLRVRYRSNNLLFLNRQTADHTINDRVLRFARAKTFFARHALRMLTYSVVRKGCDRIHAHLTGTAKLGDVVTAVGAKCIGGEKSSGCSSSTSRVAKTRSQLQRCVSQRFATDLRDNGGRYPLGNPSASSVRQSRSYICS
jgi:hypothetical protein